MVRGLHHRAHVLILSVVVSLSTGALPGCYRDNSCRDPTNDGM